MAVLEAAAFLEGQTVPDMVRSVLDARVSVLANDPQIQLMLRLRSERAAMAEGKLSPLVRRPGGRESDR